MILYKLLKPRNITRIISIFKNPFNLISHGGGGLWGPPLEEIIIMQNFAYKTW